MDKKKKLVFQLDTPYSGLSWPQILPQDQDTILELLCNLLFPLGHYRSQHIHTSKGNRARKRKRKELSDKDTSLPVPPAPELKFYVDVGLSCVTNTLQKTASEGVEANYSRDSQGAQDRPASRFYSAIFVARSGQPNALSSHLPQMVAVACKSHPLQPSTRLVELPRSCEGRLYESLGIPRVSCIGICVDTPNSTALVDFVREHVPVLKIPWLQEATCAEYRGTKITTIETAMGVKKKTKEKITK